MSGPIPLIVCGRSTAIASSVIAGLKPDYEGIFSLPRTTPILNANYYITSNPSRS